MKATKSLLLAALFAACARPPASAVVVDDAGTSLEGVARDSKASAVLVTVDGRVVHVSGMSGWPTGVEGQQVKVTGRLVQSARLPRARQDADGNWSQGVAADSPPEWWLDDPAWSLVGVAPEPGPWTVRVTDGNNNLVVITMPAGGDEAAWRYEPVLPEASSSGTYSGGEPADGHMDNVQMTRLWSLVRALESADDLHTPERAMGTVQIAVQSVSGSRTVELLPGSADDLEAWLAALRGC